jgi:hypothetical protein
MYLCVLETFVPSSKRLFDGFWSHINFTYTGCAAPLSARMWFPATSVSLCGCEHTKKSLTHKDGPRLLPTRVDGQGSSKAACKVGRVLDSTVRHIGDFRAQRH